MKLKLAKKIAKENGYQYVAVDRNNEIFAYASKPVTFEGGWVAVSDMADKMKTEQIGRYNGNNHWDKTLRFCGNADELCGNIFEDTFVALATIIGSSTSDKFSYADALGIIRMSIDSIENLVADGEIEEHIEKIRANKDNAPNNVKANNHTGGVFSVFMTRLTNGANETFYGIVSADDDETLFHALDQYGDPNDFEVSKLEEPYVIPSFMFLSDDNGSGSKVECPELCFEDESINWVPLNIDLESVYKNYN